jgi:hypothetical protein
LALERHGYPPLRRPGEIENPGAMNSKNEEGA